MHAKNNALGYLGLLCGIFALGAALFHFWMGPFSEPPALEDVVANEVQNLREALAATIAGQEIKSARRPKPYNVDKLYTATTVTFGFLAIVLATLAFVRREDARASAAGAVLGLGAVAFQFSVAALGFIALSILVAMILSKLNISSG